MSGYVRIHRALIGHPAFRNDAEAMAFAWLVVRAAWKPVRVRYKGHAISLDRGQLALSVRDFAEAMDRDKTWIERLLNRCRREGMAQTRCETGVNVITICNYNSFQPEGKAGETLAETANETDARQAQDTEQVREEGKKDTQETSSPSSHKAFPRPDWAEPQIWADFMTNRRKRRMTNSATAYRQFLADVARLSDDEWPPGRLLEYAAGKSWGSINDPRQDRRNGHPQPDTRLRPSLRGSRPDPSLDFVRQANAEIAAERCGTQNDRGAWPALPSFGPS